MPRRNGTGPMSMGAMTGRGLGVCSGVNAAKEFAGFSSRIGLRIGLGLGHRPGCGRRFFTEQTTEKGQKELLQNQKKLLENRISIIDKQLDNL